MASLHLRKWPGSRHAAWTSRSASLLLGRARCHPDCAPRRHAGLGCDGARSIAAVRDRLETICAHQLVGSAGQRRQIQSFRVDRHGSSIQNDADSTVAVPNAEASINGNCDLVKFCEATAIGPTRSDLVNFGALYVTRRPKARANPAGTIKMNANCMRMP